jgi:hypothetical protein
MIKTKRARVIRGYFPTCLPLRRPVALQKRPNTLSKECRMF